MATHAPITGAPTRAPSIPALPRRSFLGALAAAPAVAAVPAIAIPAADAGIMDAWTRRQRALAEIEKRGDYFDAEEHSPSFIDAYDEAEGDIAAATATTPRGVWVKLWLALNACTDGFSAHKQKALVAIRRADLEALRPLHRSLDWDSVLLFQAIDSLTRIVGRA